MIALLVAVAFTNTAHVESIALAGATLWAATGGGVEQYDLRSGSRVRVYPIGPALRIWSNDQNAQTAHARTRDAECVIAGETVSCAPAAPLPAVAPSAAPL